MMIIDAFTLSKILHVIGFIMLSILSGYTVFKNRSNLTLEKDLNIDIITEYLNIMAFIGALLLCYGYWSKTAQSRHVVLSITNFDAIAPGHLFFTIYLFVALWLTDIANNYSKKFIFLSRLLGNFVLSKQTIYGVVGVLILTISHFAYIVYSCDMRSPELILEFIANFILFFGYIAQLSAFW